MTCSPPVHRRTNMGAQYQIEDGVPIPETTTRQGSNIVLLKSMKPGQSVFFGGADMKKATRFYRVAKKLGIPIEVHKVEEKGVVGQRMWRVEEIATPKQLEALVRGTE